MKDTPTLNAHRVAIRAGLARGLIETRQSLAGFRFLAYLLFPTIYFFVLLFQRNSTVPGTDFSLGAMVLPSLVGMSIAFGGLLGPAGTIAVEREDLIREAIEVADAQNAPIADCIIAALAQDSGCRVTMTFDKPAARLVPGMELLA